MKFILLLIFFVIFFIIYNKFLCKRYYIITYDKDPEIKAIIRKRTESKDNKIINYYFSVKN